jgi:predicted dehydrogenase
MSDPVKVAVTGAGGEARLYMDAYVRSEDSELVLVQDISEPAAKAQGERLGVPWTTEFDDLLADDIDVIDVSTPNHLHLEQTRAAVAAGKHVLCQKPMAPTVADCDAMIAAAKEHGRELGIYMGMLSSPFFHELREMVRSGAFGIISSVSSRGAHLGGYRAKDNTPWRGSLEKTGGGAFIQLAVHGYNLFQWLLDEDIVAVSARSTNRLCKHSIGGDDNTHAVAEFSGGAYGTFEAGYAALGGFLAVNGTTGAFMQTSGVSYLWLEAPWEGPILSYTPLPERQMTTLDQSEIGRRSGPMRAEHDQHEAFVRAIRNGQPAPVPGQIGRRDVAVAKAVYLAAEEGRSVELSELA